MRRAPLACAASSPRALAAGVACLLALSVSASADAAAAPSAAPLFLSVCGTCTFYDVGGVLTREPPPWECPDGENCCGEACDWLNLFDCPNCGDLSSLAPNVFKGMGSLQFLDLANNRLSWLPAGTFWGLSGLETLWLSDNDAMMSIEPGAFAGLGKVVTLSLWSNNLSSLPANVFAGMGSLETLWLNSNALTSIEEGALDGLGKLRWLSLEENMLASLPGALFVETPGLMRLWLKDNVLAGPQPPGLLAPLANLTRLDIKGNGATLCFHEVPPLLNADACFEGCGFDDPAELLCAAPAPLNAPGI